MINAAELAGLQAAFLPTFTATATVLHRVQVRDNSGGFMDSYPTAGAETVACSFRRTVVTPREFERDVRIQSITFWSFSFPIGTDIRTTDRLLVGTRTFEVVASNTPSRPITLDVTAQEIL